MLRMDRLPGDSRGKNQGIRMKERRDIGKIRRLFIGTIVFLILLVFPICATTEIYAPSFDLTNGSSFSIPISINGTSNATGVSFILVYNASVIQVDNIVNNASVFGDDTSVTVNIDNTAGEADIAATNTDTGLTASFLSPLVDVLIHSTGTKGVSALNFSQPEFSFPNFSVVSFDIISQGLVNILEIPLPVADFTSNATSGTAPLAVEFYDNSTGLPISWNWSFGDDNISESQNPVHVYAFPGTFTVSLNATNAGGSNVSVQTNHITVIVPKPIPDFSANVTSGTAPLPVTFTDQSLNNPTGWAWFFGDEPYNQPWIEMNASAGWSGRMLHSSVALPDGSIVLMGGWGPGLNNDVWRSTDNGATWTQMNASAGWAARYSHTSVAMPDGSIVLMGGDAIGGSLLNDVWRSTDNGATWTQVNASAGWTARESHTSVAMPDGSIVLMGGGVSGSRRNDVWWSTDNGETWTLVNASAGWTARQGHSSVAMPDGSIVLMGGYGIGGEKNDTWRSTDNGETWTLVNASAGWTARQGHSSVAMPDGSIVLMGGWGPGLKNDVWRSTDNGATWTQMNASAGWTARSEHRSVVMPDGNIVLIGGNDGIDKNDVWRFTPTGSSAQNPSHTYTAPGVYMVALQAYNAGGCNLTTKPNYINVSAAIPTGPVRNLNTGLTYTTIQAAVSAGNTVNGHIISIDNGTYQENIIVPKEVTIRSASADPRTTVIEGLSPTGNVVSLAASNVTISGFTIRNATGSGSSGVAVGAGFKNCTISGNTIQNTSNGISLSSNSYTTIENNTIENTGDNGIFVFNPNRDQILNNTIRNPLNTGIYLYGDHGTFSSDIQGNTLIGPSTGTSILFTTNAGGIFDDNNVTSNTISNSTYGIRTDTASSWPWTRIQNSRFGNNTLTNTSYGFYLYGDGYLLTVSGNTFTGNTIDQAGYGFYLKGSDSSGHNGVSNNIFSDNRLSDIQSSGVYFDIGNTIFNDFGGTNTINGYPFQHYYNRQNLTLTGLEVNASADTTNYGLFDIVQCRNLTISDSSINGDREYGIYLYDSDEIRILNNTVYGNGDAGGEANIYIVYDNASLVKDNAISSGRGGIRVSSSQNGVILVNNTIEHTGDNGIFVFNPNRDQILNNTIRNPLNSGIYLYGNSGTFSSDIRSNTLIGPATGTSILFMTNAGGIFDGNNVTNNTISNSTYGIRTDTASGWPWTQIQNSRFGNNTVSNTSYGFYLYGDGYLLTVSGNTFTGNTIDQAGYGFYLKGSDSSGHNGVSNNIFSDNRLSDIQSSGVYFDIGNTIFNDFGSTNTINGYPFHHYYNHNDITLSGLEVNASADTTNYGLFDIVQCRNLTISDSSINGDREYGIYLHDSDEIRILNNTLYGNGDAGAESNMYIVYDNASLVKNNTISSGRGGIRVSSSQNGVILENNTIENTGDSGIFVFNPNRDQILNNTIRNASNNGIYLYGDHGTFSSDIRGNTLFGPLTGTSILFTTNAGGIFQENNITGNTISNATYGIRTDTASSWPWTRIQNNRFGNNTVSNTSYGFYLSGDGYYLTVSANTFTGNTIRNSSTYGFYIQSSGSNGVSGNLVYDNYFNNTNNARDNDNNQWNITKTAGTNSIGGSWLGGNYWSNYTGVDSNSDGFGDTFIPYKNAGSIQNGGDWLPLTNQTVQPPIVNFSVNVSSGTAPLAVQFYDNSTGSPTSWNWSFGDGNFSVLQNPAHLYELIGTFTVSLNATNAWGGNTTIGTNIINIHAPPPTVTGISPAFGSNTTSLSITNLSGANFNSSATVILTPVNINPVQKGSIVDGGGGAPYLNAPQSVYVSGNYAYVVSYYGKLEIVDVSNPASPVHKGSIVDGGGNAPYLGGAMSVYVSGNYAYVVSGGSNALEIVDVSNPASPVHKGSIVDGGGSAPFLKDPRSVYVSGNYAYVASYGGNALEIVDVSNPASPMHKGSIVDGGGSAPFLNWPVSVYVSGNYAYVASYGGNALEIVDVSNPASPVHKGGIVDGGGSAPFLGQPRSVYVSGNYAYVARGNALEIVDVSNPASPVHKGGIVDGGGSAPFLNQPFSVYVSGNNAYVASFGSHALEIVDVSNPASPVHKGSIVDSGGSVPFLNGPVSVYVSDNYAYVASTYSNALEIVDIGTVTATGINVVTSSQITGTLNLINKIAGSYNVVVTNPDGQSGSLPGGFTITMSEPVASFTANVTSGTVPLEVRFFDNSTGTPTSWNWSFGNSNFSVLQNPVHLYEFAGTFTVSLNVTNAGGSNISVRTNYIVVKAPKPFANFTANVTSGTAPLPVSFTDLSLNSPTGWAWFFGDENYTAPWTSVNTSSGWSARYAQSSVAMPDGSIVLMGGYGGSWKNDTWRSTDNGAHWTLVNASSGWSARYAQSSVAMPDGSIVLTGGTSSGVGDTNDVWRSTDNGATWSRQNVSAGWSIRDGHSSVVMPDGSIVLMGGEYGSNYKNDVWRSTDNGITWTNITTSGGWSARYAHSSVVMPDGSIVLMGGYGGSWKNDTWRSTNNGATWTVMNASSGWMARYLHNSVAMPDGSIVLMGGNAGSGSNHYKNDVWLSKDNGATWTQTTSAAGWVGREDQSTVAMRDGSIVLMGGLYASGYLNDTYRLNPVGSSAQNPSHTYTAAGIYQVALQAYNNGGYNSTRKAGYITVTSGAGESTPAIEWQQSYGGSGTDRGYGFQQTSDDGYIVVGWSDSTDGDLTTNYGLNDIWLLKLSSSGSIDWQQSYGGSGQDLGYAVRQTSDGGYIFGGITESIDGDVTSNHGSEDFWVVKTDGSGAIQWQNTFGGSDWDGLNDLLQTSDGGYVAVGYTQSTDGDVTTSYGNADIWVVKLDGFGGIDWQKSYGGTGADHGAAIRQTSDGGYIVAGTSDSADNDVTGNHGDTDYWVVKLDGSGNIDWQKSVGGSSYESAESIQQTSDGGYIVFGSTDSSDGDVTGNHGNVDFWVVKLDDTGSLVWEKALGGSGSEFVFGRRSLTETSDGAFIVTGASDSNDGDRTGACGDQTFPSGLDFWTVKLGTTGDIIWQLSLGGTNTDQAKAVAETNDGYLIISGISESDNNDVSGNHGMSDVWITKLTDPSTPSAGIDADVTSGSAPLTVHFIDASGGTPTSWNWSFGDGDATNSTRRNPYHTYAAAGTYTVSLTVNNSAAGQGYTENIDYIVVSPPSVPVANFTANVTSGTAPLAVQFYDNSTGTPTSWNWSFGDGNFSVLQNPVHIYTFAGTFTVTLNATNAGGSNVSVRTNYIVVNVLAPEADFTANITAGFAPLSVQFSDNSTGSPTTWNWTFGDMGAGNTSTLQNPIHTYTTYGNFTVNLTAANAGGNSTIQRVAYISVKTRGDINNNGHVDIGDVTSVAYMGIGLVPPDITAADFNHNGRIDIGDAAKIAYYYVGKISTL